ncbi:hypothetical protein [Reichenbachiella sp.]|uniref:hypothetical protein n=1 Tax=Reichenbachiella sp. TaxID=2184521 RepID=UPI00329A0169
MPIDSNPERFEIFNNEDTKKLKAYLGINPPDKELKHNEWLSIDRSREVDFDWSKILPTLEVEPKELESSINYLKRYFENSWKKENEEIDIATVKKYISEAEKGTIEDGVTGQKYKFKNIDFKELSMTGYQEFWSLNLKLEGDKIKTDEVDMSRIAIFRQVRELSLIEPLLSKFSKVADDWVNKINSDSLLSKTDLENLLSKYLSMKTPHAELGKDFLVLADKARDLGFVLIPPEPYGTTQKDVKYPNGDKFTFEAGKLYQPYKTTISWTEVHTVIRYRKVKRWFHSHVVPYPVNIVKHRKKLVEKYEAFIPDIDPIKEKLDELNDKEFESFIFDYDGYDLITSKGESLSDVLEQCRFDSDFRKKCVVWIPIFEQKITEGDILVKYVLYHSPVPGIKPVHFPKLFIQEKLSYRSAWEKIELGELIHTINLAPGEERTISIERTRSNEVEIKKTTTSLLDLTETENNDISTEIEKVARNSNERVSSRNWNIKAKGSFFSGALGISGGAGGTTKMTISQFASLMENLVRKASNSITKKQRQEISTASNVKKTNTVAESTTLTISNINEGKTLNLMFYSLYNKFKGGVFLNDLQLITIPSVESIAGSGIIIPKTYNLNELKDCLENFAPDDLPLSKDISDDTDLIKYWMLLVSQLKDTLVKEYSKEGGNSASIKKVKFTDYVPKEEVTDNDQLSDYLDEISKALLNIEIDSDDFLKKEHTIKSPSNGVYLDAFVGVREATEAYSEEMRAQEVQMRKAEVIKEKSSGEYTSALAKSIKRGVTVSANKFAVNVKSSKKLEFAFDKHLAHGEWQLIVDGQLMATKNIENGTKEIKFKWENDQSWLNGEINNNAILLHNETNEIIPLRL